MQEDKDFQPDVLDKSTTLYVGNLSFYTTEEQIYELFSKYYYPLLSLSDGAIDVAK